MSEKINCPFCGNLVELDAIKCDKCGALYKEPELPNFKFHELGSFIAIDVLTLGFFSTLWFFINGNAINKLASNKKDGIKLNWLIVLLALNGAFYLFCFYKLQAWLILVALVQCIIYIALSYRVLRIIQKYTKNAYNSDISFNVHYMLIFNIFYLIHYIETYSKRVYHTYPFFDWKSPQAIMLLVLLTIIICIARFYNELFMLIH